MLGSEDQWGGRGVSPQSTMWTLGVELRLVAWQELSPPAELSPSFTIGCQIYFCSAFMFPGNIILTASNLGSLHFLNLCR